MTEIHYRNNVYSVDWKKMALRYSKRLLFLLILLVIPLILSAFIDNMFLCYVLSSLFLIPYFINKRTAFGKMVLPGKQRKIDSSGTDIIEEQKQTGQHTQHDQLQAYQENNFLLRPLANENLAYALQTLPANEYFEFALRTAVLTPMVGMKTADDFEPSLDAVRFHLEIALAYADSYNKITTIQQVTQQLIYLYFQLIIHIIEQQRNSSAESFLQNIQPPPAFAEWIRKPPLNDYIAPMDLGELENSIASFVQSLYHDHQMGKRFSIFYLQVARSYRKIALSKIYSSKYDVIDNIINRQSLDIINGIISLKEFDEGLEFVALLKSRNFFSADRVEQALIGGYRKSLLTGFKGSARFVTYAYINILLGLLTLGLCFYNLLFIILLVADILAVRYLWRFGPKIATLRSQINKRAEEIARTKPT